MVKENHIGPYKMGSTLGVGTFGKVKLAMHEKTGQKVAIKVINKMKMQSMDMHEKIRRELNILQCLNHPHVMRLYELVDTPTDIFMVMEYVPGGELFDHIVQKSRLSENEARRFFQQIIAGVEYCHHHMVCHRDLKPENVLLDTNMNVKVGDFGLSNFMKEGEFLKTSCGSPNYASPEVVSGKAYAGPEVDVWSCGVILYALLCGSLPFDDEHVPNLFKKIKHGNFTLPGHLPENARKLIVSMLVVDPAKRITIKEIRRHPWFKQSLPPYLSGSNLKSSFSTSIDFSITDEMKQLGYEFDPKKLEINTPVGSFPKNETVAYHLLSQKRQKQNSFSNMLPYYPKDAPSAFSMESKKMTAFINQGDNYEYLGSHEHTNFVTCHNSRNSSPIQIQGSPIDYSPGTPAWTSFSWKLGLEASLESSLLVNTIFKTLKLLNYDWNIVTPYKIRCRSSRKPASPELADEIVNLRGNIDPLNKSIRLYPPENVILCIQLYKIAQGRYLIDIQVFDGPVFACLSESVLLNSAIYSKLSELKYQPSPTLDMTMPIIWSPSTPVMMKSNGLDHRIFG